MTFPARRAAGSLRTDLFKGFFVKILISCLFYADKNISFVRSVSAKRESRDSKLQTVPIDNQSALQVIRCGCKTFPLLPLSPQVSCSAFSLAQPRPAAFLRLGGHEPG
jgi:hypothetical protein